MSDEWVIEHGVTCVVCPGCAFTFDATHTDPDGSYSCPNCGYPERSGAQALTDPTQSVFGSTTRGAAPYCGE